MIKGECDGQTDGRNAVANIDRARTALSVKGPRSHACSVAFV